MARTTATVSFQALELKGSLLPASLLEEVSKFTRPKELLLEAADYGLAKGERLRDRIDAAWVLTKELWEEYTNLKERAGESTAGLHFGQRFLKEVLEWGDVQPCNGWQHGESAYPITHRAFAGAVPLILKGIDAGELDRGSSQFGQDGRKRSAHSCLQECLNADDNANWGVLLSGDRLRLLHDNPSLVKPAYLAADLELMVEGERFDEFSVLWLLLHASRFQHPQTGNCVLDDWKQKAEESGERVLGALRGGVQNALESLGWGFLNHPANGELRAKLQSGQLSRQQFHEQLLRLVYRFLFLFTAEDRDLLFPREVEVGDPRRRIYREGYSVSRLRELAIKRSAYEGNYGDLWELQRLVFQQLSIGNSPLGLPGLGGLFSLEQCPDLQGAELWNGPLLRAIKAIGWFDAGGTFTRVRYRDLNTEELGSVYEGLLELHPQIEQQGSQWQLSYSGGAGSDRKTTGSYYTPDALVQELIKSALVPVIEDRLSKASGPAEQEEALRNIKVIDPACGSGHFLLAAARRLAVALAQVRAGDDQPSEDDRQHALRDVVAHCIYAVDKNPMAVELCKVALWIEAIDPGKPLSFLDAHIQCGDSLVGVFDPKVLEEGIPDEAYKPLTGDDKTVCSSLKKENAAARKTNSRKGSNRGIQGSLDLSGTKPRSRSQDALQAIEAMPETTLAESAAKQAAYANWLAESGQDPEALAADLFTAAFFLGKTSGSRTTVPTTEHLLKLLAGQAIDEDMEDAVVHAARNFRFFHWHLRFGEVMEKGGFDCVLGNPPWEVMQISEKEFFASAKSSLAQAKGAERKDSIERLKESDSALHEALQRQLHDQESLNSFVKHSGRYPYCGQSKMNTFALFAEEFRHLRKDLSRAGLVVPTSLAFASSTVYFFRDLLASNEVISLLSFFETRQWFKETDDRNPFCLLTYGTHESPPEFVFNARSIQDITDRRRRFSLGFSDIMSISSGTGAVPTFCSSIDSGVARTLYSRLEGFKSSTSWVSLKQNVFSSSLIDDLREFSDRRCDSNNVAVFRGALFSQYEIHSVSGVHNRTESNCSDKYISQEYYKHRLQAKGIRESYHLAIRRIVRATDARTMIAAMLPEVGTDDTASIVSVTCSIKHECALLANLNSIPMDFACGFKIGGTDIRKHNFFQLPILPAELYSEADLSFIVPRVLELTYIDTGFKSFALDLGCEHDPFSVNEPRRSKLKAELDAYYSGLYGLSRDELRYILDPSEVMGPNYPSETFRVLKSNEIRQFGEYRTLRLVLEAWDRLFGK